MPKRRKITEPTPQLGKNIDVDEERGGKHHNLNEHPLLNHLVLERIFPRLIVEDLKQIRLVCKFWHSTSLKIWRSQTTVTLGPPSADSNSSNDLWPVNQFCRKFEDSTDFLQLAEIPFTGMTLKAINFQQCQQFDTIDAPDDHGFNFWNDIGPLLTHLHFHSCTFYGNSQEVFEKILKEKLPNLEMLQLTGNDASNVTGCRYLKHMEENEYEAVANSKQICNLKTLKINGDVPMCPAILLLNSPKIESLYAGGDWDPNLLRTVNRVKLQLDGKACQVKHLDLMECVTECSTWFVGQWQAKKIHSPIEHLSVTGNLGHSHDSDRFLFYIVWSCAKTLQVLKIFRPPAYGVLHVFPFGRDMSTLRELHLSGNVVRYFCFLSAMPNLEVLYVDYHCLDETALMGKVYQKETGIMPYEPYETYLSNDNFTEHSVEKLKILHFDAQVHPRFIDQLAKLIPKLEVLRTVLQNDGFQQVCTHFPNLEELVLLNESKVSVDEITRSENAAESGGKNDPKIVLKKLKRFELHALCDSDSTSDDFRINDEWVYKFLLRSPSLEHVYIPVSKLMTPCAEEALRKHVRNVTVIRGRQGDPEHDLKCKLCPQTNAKRRYIEWSKSVTTSSFNS